MPDLQLYASAFPQDALRRVRPQAQRQQSKQGVLQESVPSVRTIATEPGTRTLEGEFAGQYADVMAAELNELLGASDVIGEVPFFDRSETREWAGYYAPQEQREGDRQDPRVSGVHRFAGVLSPVGSRQSHVRAIKVTPDTVTNPFGGATTETLYLPTTASRPRWVYEPDGKIEAATVQSTQNAEHLDVDEFDATEPSFDGEASYALVYDVPYDDEWQTDPRVWDDYGRAKSVTDSNGVTVDPTWQRVYRTQHEYVGGRVIDNGRVRVEPVPSTNSFDAYQWDNASSDYSSVSLGTSDWELLDWDVRRIGLERVVSLTTWRDSTDTSTTYELVAEVRRGFDEVQFYEPKNASGSTPSGLVTLLDPIAHDSVQVLDEAQTVMKRSEVPEE